MTNDAPKIIARYLPQFHQIPENDIWWGKGFTEWTTVRLGKVLFEGHTQPNVPMEGNYYDLLSKETMVWQADLARRYGVDGFSFYHYWFKDGRQILERPAENLLKWTDIDLPFCFTWANETWARTWSNLAEKNVWMTKEKAEYSPNDDGVLLRQAYGEKEDWLKHICYLLPFFQDSRYICYEGKPVFIIYKPETLHCWPDMRELWEAELRKAGFDGLYVIGEQQTDVPVYSPSYDAVLWRFPNRCFRRMKANIRDNGVSTYDYDEYWQMILNGSWHSNEDERSFYCVAPRYDDTPRHGKNGVVLTGATPEKFKQYFSKLLQREAERENYFVFINAWNEWGEGAYLEPDEENAYDYLQAIRESKDLMGKPMIQCCHVPSQQHPFDRRLIRYQRDVKALDIWMSIKEQGKSIASWLKEHGWNRVAIYGLGYLGRHLLAELENSEVEVVYVVDQNANHIFVRCPLYNLRTDLPNVDAMIVTPAGQYDTIRHDIRRFVDYKTISLEHILTELL